MECQTNFFQSRSIHQTHLFVNPFINSDIWVFLLTYLGSAWSSDYWFLLASRAFVGFGLGGAPVSPILLLAHSEFFSNFIKYASVSHNPVLVVVGWPFLSYKFPHLHMYLLHVLLESRWSLACWFLKPHTHPYQFLSGCYGSSFHFRVWHLLFPAYLRSFWDFQYCCSLLPALACCS